MDEDIFSRGSERARPVWKRGRLPLLLMALGGFSLAFLMDVAGEVTLKSPDGEVNVSGELLDFTANRFTIQTNFGPVNFDANRVSCKGASCPTIEPPTACAVADCAEESPEVA